MRCVTPARFIAPSTISITPTDISIERPTRGGITTLKAMIAAPTITI
jgi:hypothetical protein